MKKATSLILATAIAGTLAFTTMAPAVYAQSNGKSGEQSERMGKRGGQGGPGGFIRLMCSDQGAERLETAMGRVAEKVDLTADQQTLLNNLKTTALSAQTSFADSCTTPATGDDADMIDRVRARQANAALRLAAMDEIVPALESFYDSLTDEQKAELKPEKRGGDRRGGNKRS